MITRDTILAILDVHLSSYKAINGKGEAADRILAAIEKEQGKEVVLGRGCANNICSMCGNPFRSSIYHGKCEKIRGQVGQLIFRPTKAEKGGE